MSTQIDWRAELDSSFGTGADRPPTDYLVPARAALRKRRAAMGAAALVSVIVVGGIGWALAPGESTRAIDDQVATNSASPTPVDTTSLGPHLSIHRMSEVSVDSTVDRAWVELDGEVLNIAPDVEVGDWTANPMGYTQPHNSVGVQVFRGDQEQWMLLASGRHGPTWATWDQAHKRHATFQDWLADAVAFQKGVEETTTVELVDGQLATLAGVEILDQVIAPPEAAAYGPVEDTAAVEVLLPSGQIRFVLAIESEPGTPTDNTVVNPLVLERPTMAAFLAHLQRQGDNGEGLR